MPKVLVVEDDTATRLLFEALLRQQNFECTAVDNGAAALKALEKGRYDAVVLDLLLPEVNGFEVIRAIEQTDPAMLRRVLVCTALPLRRAADNDRLRGVAAVLSKPLDIDRLLTAVDEACGVEPVAARPFEPQKTSGELQ